MCATGLHLAACPKLLFFWHKLLPCMSCDSDNVLMTVLQAQAINGGTDRNAVVYTPCIVLENGLHLYNFTLPDSMVCSDVLPDLGMP